MSNKSEFRIQISNDIIRNPSLDHDSFYVYAKLTQHYFVSKGKTNKLQIDHKKFMYFSNIKSNQTFKKTLNQLYDNNLILNKIDTLPRHATLEIIMNDEYLKKDKVFKFAQLPYWMLDKYILDIIKFEGFRLIYYFKSYIDKNREFCFTSRETISKEIGSNPKNIDKYVKLLKKYKLIKVEKHELEGTGVYEEDEFGNEKENFVKFNNHYFLPNSEEQLKKIVEKLKVKR